MILIGKVNQLKHGQKLHVATTHTALNILPRKILQNMNVNLDLCALSHPLHSVISGNEDEWVNFCGLEDFPRASWKGRGSASEAWTQFQGSMCSGHM
jgi:hypothetical protein